MQELKARQVVVSLRPAWAKWPVTEDTNFDNILAKRWETVHIHGDTKISITNRFLPVYLCYRAINFATKPPDYPTIDNLVTPPPAVVQEQIKLLTELASWGDCILWEHARGCYPTVASMLPNLFSHRILVFGDDLPGWNERRTYPIAKFFTSLLYSMYVVSFQGGEKTDRAYARHGLEKAYFHPCGMTGGLPRGLDEMTFSIEEKAARIARGELPPIDLVFVGMFSGHPWRGDVLREVYNTVPAGLTVRAHGWKAPGGILPGHLTPQCGYHLAKLYAQSLFGINPQMTSLFNTRLMDLWHSGVAQIIYDPHGELVANGFRPGEHYISFNGSSDYFWRQLHSWRSKPKELSELILRAHVAASTFFKETVGTAYGRLYSEELSP